MGVGVAGASSDPRFASVDAAQAKWARLRPPTYAFTYTHLGPGGVGWDWRYRVTSIGGQVQAQLLGVSSWSATDSDNITIDGLFETVRRLIANGDEGDELRVTFDPVLGYPTGVAYSRPGVADAEGTDTATDFRSGADGPSADAVAGTRAVLRSARAAWRHWEPTTYQYTWRRSRSGKSSTSGTAWDVSRANGRSTSKPDPASDRALPADSASVGSTFDAIEQALDTGAWVDLTVDPVSGLPLLVAIAPPSATTGDPYWIRITFRDTQHEVATAALQAAEERWAAAGLSHFSYTWRYRGQYKPLTYRVTWDGDRSLLRRSSGTPIPEASAYATPRIDDTFRLLQEVLAQGGRVTARYDPVLGYPVRVDLDPAGDVGGARGTITITAFVVR